MDMWTGILILLLLIMIILHIKILRDNSRALKEAKIDSALAKKQDPMAEFNKAIEYLKGKR